MKVGELAPADTYDRLQSGIDLSRLIVLFCFVVLAILLASTWIGRGQTMFDVNANTDVFTLEMTEKPRSGWPLFAVTRMGDTVGSAFTGTFHPAARSKARFERRGKGPLVIEVESIDKTSSCGEFYHGSDDKAESKAPALITLTFPVVDIRSTDPGSVLIPINGQVMLGREVGVETLASGGAAILHSGRMVLSTSAFLDDRLAPARDIDLAAGDYVAFKGRATSATGFMFAAEDRGMQLVFRVEADSASITRAGASSQMYAVFVSWIDIAGRDKIFLQFLAIFGAMSAVYQIWGSNGETTRALQRVMRLLRKSGEAR